MPRRPGHSEAEPSPLRRARLARNWTLEDVVGAIDARAPDGHSGVTPSMVSSWELGRHTTSIGHRKTLCEIYRQRPNDLFSHQDEGLASRGSPKLLTDFGELQKAMLATVAGASECLVATGSRSRDHDYLSAIEQALAERPGLVHYRVLFGPPRHQVLKDHLLRLLHLRDPRDRSLGIKTLHLGVVDLTDDSPERFFCASEQMAVVPIPSLTSHEAFDSGVLLAALPAQRMMDHARQAYAWARRVESVEDVINLPVLDERSAPT